jgi:hypothetical protein
LPDEGRLAEREEVLSDQELPEILSEAAVEESADGGLDSAPDEIEGQIAD